MDVVAILLILALAVARLTALVVFDSITEPIRHRVFLWFPPQPPVTGEELSHYAMMDRHGQPLPEGEYRDEHKLGVLLSCYHCVGVWVAAGAVAAIAWLPLAVYAPVFLIAALAQASDLFVKATRSDA